MKTILVDAVDCFVIEGKGVFMEMYRLLENYPNPKIVLTGANDEQIKEFGLDNIPYIFFTLKHDPEKTSPEYFKKMLKHFNLSANEVIYFEHNIDSVKSAESIGIVSFHYNPTKKNLIELKKFIEDNI